MTSLGEKITGKNETRNRDRSTEETVFPSGAYETPHSVGETKAPATTSKGETQCPTPRGEEKLP